jgi:hypothetical protein
MKVMEVMEVMKVRIEYPKDWKTRKPDNRIIPMLLRRSGQAR